jgi:hypothetical protein
MQTAERRKDREESAEAQSPNGKVEEPAAATA